MTDAFTHLDGAYVLGALDDDERRSFEAHLATCGDCRARIDEIAQMPDRLAAIGLDDLLADLAADDDAGPVPDTLLPALVGEVRAGRRRRHTLLAVAGTVAAACVAALVAVLITTSSSSAPPTPVAFGRPMVQVVPTPVHARVRLLAEGSGTRVVLHCHYDAGRGRQIEYGLVVYDRAGTAYTPTVFSSWYIGPGEDVTIAAPAPVAPDQIGSVEVTLADGRPILRLRN